MRVCTVTPSIGCAARTSSTQVSPPATAPHSRNPHPRAGFPFTRPTTVGCRFPRPGPTSPPLAIPIDQPDAWKQCVLTVRPAASLRLRADSPLRGLHTGRHLATPSCRHEQGTRLRGLHSPTGFCPGVRFSLRISGAGCAYRSSRSDTCGHPCSGRSRIPPTSRTISAAVYRAL